MSDNTPILPSGNNEQPALPPEITVSEAIALVATWIDLSAARRSVLISSLRTIARIAETDAIILALSPAVLNAQVLRKASQLYGISAPSMSTTRSGVRFVMRRLGVLHDPKPLNDTWAAVSEQLPNRVSHTLTCLMKYLSQEGVAPYTVSDENFAAFQAWVLKNSLCRNPSRMFAQTRYAWNKASRTLPGFNLPVLGAARCRSFSSVPLEAMDPALQAEIARLAHRLRSSDLDLLSDDDVLDQDVGSNGQEGAAFQPVGPRRPLTALTIEGRIRHLRQAIWALNQLGVPLADIRSLRDLMTPLNRVRDIIRFMRDRSGKDKSTSAAHVAEALRQVAKFHIGLSDEDVVRIARWKTVVDVKYTEMTERNQRRLEPLLTPAVEAAILALPEVLMNEAVELLPASPGRAVSAAKRALGIHLTLFYAFRVSNVVTLRRDRHFIETQNGARRRIERFFIPASEVKNRQILDRLVLSLTNELIAKWETHFRPLIAAPGNPYLFPGKEDQPMTRQAFGDSLKKIVIERVGCEINPHILRHRAAVAYLKKHPGEFEVVRQVLGHKTDQTARRSYTGPERDAAFDRFDQSVLESMKLRHPIHAKKARPISGKCGTRPTSPTRSTRGTAKGQGSRRHG
ncbi:MULTISPECIES: tyrosine-type recombinase/integrase [Acidiphilium]|uniref:Site-specific recombinase XerD n=1 Tax=Acidiphilium rubrum TaxID=526 RepID=A0A8G2FIA9_ACIRU|nr:MULTISPECIES: tyrosine-type recombinase/integrase [Acidiphilium]SIR55094.1 Site-specific recombinase XerD [Acidiphilium rubrum]